ncbi:MAG TPA: 23S rRNA (adenine(2503)-C(2))-methyltransferase RlmN [Gemmatimonadaceae bacterium]|nr:23S rRNA (adenine(2503)-C(2))-methyltransferase RlmN [Gemmatimonadaceae bacterium]
MDNLLDLPRAEAELRLGRFMHEAAEPEYRARQVASRLWRNPAASFAEMTELPVGLRDRLAAAFSLPRLALDARQRSQDGTEKFLFRLHDGEGIETVAIPEQNRLTLCISSQAGCALQCAFCATGAMGFSRNLSAFEIVGQVRELILLGLRPTNIVFMGMGEPLMNWKAADVALSLLNDPGALGIGARHITVSTVGVLPGIQALAARPEQFRLALSIHAPTDELRQKLMPINTKYPLADVIDAAKSFVRRVTFEYVLLGGVNDSVAQAGQLATLARACGAFVNLIPLHPGGALGFSASSTKATAAFMAAIRKRGVEVALRKSRGIDISAACGQLRVERLGRPDRGHRVESTALLGG